MEWFLGLIGGTLIKGFVNLIPQLIGDELRTRGVIRTMNHQDRLSQVADERRHAARMAYLDEEHQRQLLLERYKNLNTHYPLGTIGRLRSMTTDQRPAVLVSPMSFAGGTSGRVPGLVHDALRQIPDFSRHAALHTGAFVSDSGVSRLIEGSTGAAEISALEFPSHPAVLVYFEADGDHLNAFAYLSSLFPTIDGQTGFPIRIACFGWDDRTTTDRPGEGALPVWQYVNMTELDYPDEQIVAGIVAWFVLTCVETYWQLRGAAVSLRPDTAGPVGGPVPGPVGAPAQAIGAQEVGAQDVFACRVEMEVMELERRGFTVETLELDRDRVALIVSTNALGVSFVLDAGFPATPPDVFFVEDTGPEHLELDASIWSPERTLLDIVEVLG
ncbi:hypothetical protein [Nonomuraea guangzhouensis]|uniref:Uncharacterized protein n=1 Tax=Nonomuraea guangzhouensis TaxID=1291555 RepID=A0ABW4GJQ6_9ACTN|nr:hypothetical protein [Nonomuraea guangzhouensis]